LNHLPSFGIYFKNLRSSAKEEKPEISKYKKTTFKAGSKRAMNFHETIEFKTQFCPAAHMRPTI